MSATDVNSYIYQPSEETQLLYSGVGATDSAYPAGLCMQIVEVILQKRNQFMDSTRCNSTHNFYDVVRALVEPEKTKNIVHLSLPVYSSAFLPVATSGCFFFSFVDIAVFPFSKLIFVIPICAMKMQWVKWQQERLGENAKERLSWRRSCFWSWLLSSGMWRAQMDRVMIREHGGWDNASKMCDCGGEGLRRTGAWQVNSRC